VTQQTNEHLTIEQLSAFLDEQLAPSEQALCNAHLQTCEQCQNILKELRQTVALVRGLPQPELPRSFILPASVAFVPERRASQDARVTPIRQGSRRLGVYYLQRTVRALSTIAAVIGFIFLLSGLVALLPRGELTSGGSAAQAPTSKNVSGATHAPETPTAPGNTPATAASSGNQNDQTRTATRGAPTPTATAQFGVHQAPAGTQEHPSVQTRPLLQLPDLSTPEGREGFGLILLVLGVLGYLVTRRRFRQVRTIPR
jgi:hypothetical protein